MKHFSTQKHAFWLIQLDFRRIWWLNLSHGLWKEYL